MPQHSQKQDISRHSEVQTPCCMHAYVRDNDFKG